VLHHEGPPMEFPPDLPGIIEYLCGPTVIHALPRKMVEYISSSGNTNCRDVHPRIPPGATGWRLATEEAWRPMSTLPETWLPFLHRRRHWEMDPRPLPKGFIPVLDESDLHRE
jgi:hypothetical protein